MNNKKEIKIAIAWAWTVGEATIKLLSSIITKEELKGFDIKLTKVLVKDINKNRDSLQLEGNTILTDKIDWFLDWIDIFVELIGWTKLAKDLVYKAIEKGIHVVTANKALISLDIEWLNQKIKDNNIQFWFEAAVAWWIPIIRILSKTYYADKVNQISWILNWTCNYILTKMIPKDFWWEEYSYLEAFEEANKLWYAEADIPWELNPDLDWPDTRSKIAILWNLALWTIINEDNIFMQWIREIKSIDFKFAWKLNSNIKFVANIINENNNISYFVSPTIISNNNEISKTNWVTNIVNLVSDNLWSISYKWPWAWWLATANSVVCDIINIIKWDTLNFKEKNNKLSYNNNFESIFYIRIKEIYKKDIICLFEKMWFHILDIIIIEDNIAFIINKIDINSIINIKNNFKNKWLLFLPIVE